MIDAGQTGVVPTGETAMIVVVARPENAPDDGSQDIQVGTLIDVPDGEMKVGAKQNPTVPVTLRDDGGRGGNRQLVVTLDSTTPFPIITGSSAAA